MKLKRYVQAAVLLPLALGFAVQAQAGTGTGAMSDDMMAQLKTMIEQQQAQLDKQAAEIAALKEQLSGKADVGAAPAAAPEVEGIDKMVTSSFSNVNLSLYGHVNKAFLWADNGDSSDWYIVDNINSQTRLGLRANIDASSGWKVGGRIEYGIVSNASSDINQLNTSDATSSNFKLRWAEVSFKNAGVGKISLGKGSSASDSSTEIDLSGTGVASYSGYSDVGASLLWFDNATGTLSEIDVGNVHSNFDGLGRTDRVRYDSPSFGGLALAASASSGDAYDGGLFFSRKFAGTRVAAALAAANPGDLNSAVDTQYSGSVSVLLPMGLNATFSAALRELEDSTLEDPTNWWAKLGYKTKFYDAATTAFSIDYGETDDLNAVGDTSSSYGIAAVHNVIDWGTEFYLLYRLYQLDSIGADYDDIDLVMAGARVKF